MVRIKLRDNLTLIKKNNMTKNLYKACCSIGIFIAFEKVGKTVKNIRSNMLNQDENIMLGFQVIGQLMNE